MSTQKYNFYITPVEWDEEENDYIMTSKDEIDIEASFAGLKYLKCEGLEDIGKPKIYSEEYADSSRTRVYIPETLNNEPTQVKLTLLFVGANRRAVLNEFNEYIRQGFHRYYDTARKRELVFYIDSEIKISDDLLKGSTPYIQCTYTLKNVYGKTSLITK